MRSLIGRLFVFFVVALMLPLSVSAAVLSVSPTSVSAQAYVGQNATSQTVKVTKSGGGKPVKWSVVQGANWLSVSPTSGTNSGTLTLSFLTSALAAGNYNTSFTVGSSAGSTTVSVQLSMVTAPVPAAPILTLTCPGNMTVASSDGSAVVVNYSATTSGGVAPITVVGNPASGSSFPVGTTAVQVNATSSDGQTASCSFSVTVTYSGTTSSTAVGPQSTITCPAGAIDIFPGSNNIQSMVNLYAGNTTFCLRAGTFYLTSSITPKTGDSFIGEYGAILDGSGWTTTDTTQAAFRAQNQDIDYVTIANLVIRKMPQRGINAYYYMSDHWTIAYNEIASNVTGMLFPPYSTIKNNYIHHNTGGGYMGDYASYTTFDHNEIAYNGTEQKVTNSANVAFTNNYVHDNAGGGIWFDTNNTGAIVDSNRLVNNGTMGVMYEISSGITVSNNTIQGSGDTAVFISTSYNSQVYNNTLSNNFRNITYFVNCNALGGGTINFDLANNTSHNNTITIGTQSGALASGFSWTNCTSTQIAPYVNNSKNNTFSSNTYHVPSPTSGQYFFWNGVWYWSQWQGLPEDAGSTISQ